MKMPEQLSVNEMFDQIEEQKEDLEKLGVISNIHFRKHMEDHRKRKELEGKLARIQELSDEALGSISLAFQEEYIEIYRILMEIHGLSSLVRNKH